MEAMADVHARTHVSHGLIRKMVGTTSDAPPSLLKAGEKACEHCLAANSRCQPHQGTMLPAAPRPGARLHSDLTGKLRKAIMGYHYLVVFIEEYSRFVFDAYLLRSRDELNVVVRRLLADVRAVARSISRSEAMPSAVRANLDVEQLRSDNAGEYCAQRQTDFLYEHAVRPEFSPAYTKDPNGIAERYIGLIFEIVRSTLVASGAPLSFWDCCALHAVDVLNRVLHGHLNALADPEKTAFELLTLHKPSILELPPASAVAHTSSTIMSRIPRWRPEQN